MSMFEDLRRHHVNLAQPRLGAEVVEHHELGGAWSTIASRVLLQYPGVVGIAGYRHPGVNRGWRFWTLFPVGLMVSASKTSRGISRLEGGGAVTT